MDCHTKEQRSKNMRAIRSTNTKMERALAKALWHKGYRYRKNDKTVYGKPDLTFKKFKIAIFVDSEFFHGREWEINKYKIKTNRKFWWTKIESNIRRDKEVNQKLRKENWKIARFWSKALTKNMDSALQKIEILIVKRKYENEIF